MRPRPSLRPSFSFLGRHISRLLLFLLLNTFNCFNLLLNAVLFRGQIVRDLLILSDLSFFRVLNSLTIKHFLFLVVGRLEYQDFVVGLATGIRKNGHTYSTVTLYFIYCQHLYIYFS